MITALEHLTFQCHNFGLSIYKLNLKKIESNIKYFNKFLLLHDRARNARQNVLVAQMTLRHLDWGKVGLHQTRLAF